MGEKMGWDEITLKAWEGISIVTIRRKRNNRKGIANGSEMKWATKRKGRVKGRKINGTESK